jgi:alpha-amylase/alpha-mannosidase (GH57 family)
VIHDRPAIIIHGHFYQPPRENPWTEAVDREPSAAPLHDWNERVHAECYRVNAYARIADAHERVEAIINNYARISFNFGPTLLSWIARHHPHTYVRILDADRASVAARGGHGNAIAQGYNHAILPLCNERDRRTQMRWGVADFRFRFRRDPESLWLPETACDDATLGALIDEGLRYVILSPRQALRVRSVGTVEWTDVSGGHVDASQPYQYLHRDGSGRSIVVFFYNGDVAQAVAFEGALASSHGFMEQFLRAGESKVGLVHIATDGESYGHHYRFGERCLAYALEHVAPARGVCVTNYGEYLDHHAPRWEVEIDAGPHGEGTAWSCAHGVGRWARDCGCENGGDAGWNQAWRAPLRAALDLVRDRAAAEFEATRGDLFVDPWAARDAYVDLVLDPNRSRERFLEEHAPRRVGREDRVRAFTHLELQRHAMLMYTSCGWFFADVSRIETVQILKYAGRALDYLRELHGDSSEEAFLDTLATAHSNLPEMGTGADVFRRYAASSRVSPGGVAANLALAGLVHAQPVSGEIAGFSYRVEDVTERRHGRLALATGRFSLTSRTTGRMHHFALVALYFGGIDFYCVARPDLGVQWFASAAHRLWSTSRTASLATILRVAQEEFGSEEYGLEHLLPEGREQISSLIFGELVRRFSEQYAWLYEDNRRHIEMLQDAGFELPRELRMAADFTLGKRLEEVIARQLVTWDPAAYRRALDIADEVERRDYHIDHASLSDTLGTAIERAVLAAVAEPTSAHTSVALALIRLAEKLRVGAHLDRSQEALYDVLLRDEPLADDLRELALALRLAPHLVRHEPPVTALRHTASTTLADAG